MQPVLRQTGKCSQFCFKGLLKFIPWVTAKLSGKKKMRTRGCSNIQIMGTPKMTSQRLELLWNLGLHVFNLEIIDEAESGSVLK